MKSQLVRNNFSILIKYLLITCIVSLLIACDQSPQRQSIIFKITAIDINKQPVSKVKFYISGVDLMFGQTNKKGYYEDEYVATVGDVLEFRLEPPKGYTLINNINTLTVTEQEAPLEVFFTGEFNPPKHDYVFVVEGEEGDLVLVDNQNKLTLDKSKLAQFIHMGTPGSEFLIQVGEKSYQGKYSTNDEIYVITKSAQHTMVDDSIRLERAEIPKENDDTSGELDMPDLMVENETDQVEEKPENVTPRPKIK